MKLKISTYWKCQIIGWALFANIPVIFMLATQPAIIYSDNATYDEVERNLIFENLSIILNVFFFGVLTSHLLRAVIKKTEILSKSLVRQLFYTLGLTIIFSIIFIICVNISIHGFQSFLNVVISFNRIEIQALLFQGIIFNGAFLIWGLIYFVTQYIRNIEKRELEKTAMTIQILELEAKALRAQMNPHFIFNSMNSIKSLINKNENDKAANYLTTFSKLIRTLFQNSDKREVSLYEELETCKFYTQLEKMRFGDKVEFVFNVDEAIDLKDFKVPALILQPFIENAIWHGLIPKETGGIVTISVKKNDGAIQCIIEDNGIGREQSKQFKPQYEATYQSKGIGLTQSRLELDKLLNEREDAIFIIDKEDENGQSEGTKVIISFKENRN